MLLLTCLLLFIGATNLAKWRKNAAIDPVSAGGWHKVTWHLAQEPPRSKAPTRKPSYQCQQRMEWTKSNLNARTGWKASQQQLCAIHTGEKARGSKSVERVGVGTDWWWWTAMERAVTLKLQALVNKEEKNRVSDQKEKERGNCLWVSSTFPTFIKSVLFSLDRYAACFMSSSVN